jgi:hypothetical protein
MASPPFEFRTQLHQCRGVQRRNRKKKTESDQSADLQFCAEVLLPRAKTAGYFRKATLISSFSPLTSTTLQNVR